MITAAQLRAARALLGIDQRELAAQCGLSVPTIQRMEASDGVVRGKPALRAYWTEGLRRIPELHFDLEALYVGVSTIVINYRNHRGNLVNEVLRFDGELVVEGHGTYLSADPGEASGTGHD